MMGGATGRKGSLYPAALMIFPATLTCFPRHPDRGILGLILFPLVIKINPLGLLFPWI